MHQRSEWPQGMQRTDGYWRPSGGYYHPGGSQGRSWTPSGRYHPHAYPKHTNHFSNRQSEHRSYAIRWRDYSSHRDHNTYKDTSYHSYKDTVHSSPMAPGHRRGRTQGRCGGSRPFPSKRGDKNSSSLLTQGSPFKASSSSKPSSSSSSSSRSSSSLGVDSSRPDSEHSKDNSFMHRKPHSVTKTKSDVPTKQSHSIYASKSSTPSASSSSPEPVRGNHKSSTVAQSSSASVSSFGKHSESSDITPIPLSTLDFCNSVPSLREILRRKPVVVLENLTEKLIKRKLKFAGLHFNGSYAHLVSHKKTKRKILHDGGDTGPVAGGDSSTRSLKAGKNLTDVKTTNDKSDSKSDDKVSDISSLLVDPKVMSLSRPLQTAFSNNSSKTNMPFKTSGKGKSPSKMFSPKPLGPIPRHMQMFDLDKLRTKLKGANFGGSRKPRQILNQQSVFYNVNKQSGANANTDLPQCADPDDLNNAYGCTTTSLADSTKDLKSADSKHACSQEVCENEHNVDKLSDDELSKGSTFNVEIKENYEKLNVHEKDKCLQDSETPSSVCDSSNKGVPDDASTSVLAAKDDDKASQSDGEFSAGEPQEEITYDSVSSPSVTLSPPHLEAIDEEDLRKDSERKAESSRERGEEQESSLKEVTAFFEPEEMDTLCRDDDVETDTERLVKDAIESLEDKAIDSLEDKDTLEQCAPSVEESVNHEKDSQEACGSSLGDADGRDLLEGGDQEKEDQNDDGKGDKVGRESSTEKENEEVLDGHSKNDTNDNGNPRTLKDICQDLLHKRTDLLSDISLTINDMTSKSSADDNVSNESNLKCLNDPNSKTADADDPSSPVCVITSVQSGAHIYFSEGKSDLNGEALRRKPTHSQEEVLCKDIKTERSDNIDLSVNNSPRTDSQNESVLVNNEQSNYSSNAITTVSSSISGMYSPCITAQYSVVVGQVAPPCPTQLENQAMNPVLVSSQVNMQEFTSSITQRDGASTTRRESLTEEDMAPLPLGHMTLPNVPSEYPSDSQREQSANQNQSIIQNDFENHTTSVIDQDSVEIAVGASPGTETLSGEKIESQDVASICQGIQYSTELTKMVSDLDVMHYEDEEPPVLSKMNNDDTYNASELQENKFDHKDITPLTAEDSNREVDHCPESNEFHLPQSTELLTQCKVEYFEFDQEQQQEVWTHEGLIDVASIKTEPDQERIEVGRLNLHRAQGDGSEDSDATLIYSCDEDNTCFEEIFQDSLGHSWPRSAPWTDTEETESPPRYEGKLVIVSDIADDGDADGENTSDTNTSNERLSLIITTLRKDLDEKKTDRRQAKQRPVEEKSKSKDEVAAKSVKKKGKRKAVRSKRKRTSVKVPCLDAFAVAKQPPKKTQFKKRENLIVTLQRKKSSKDVFTAKSSKGMMKKESTKDIDKTRTNLKTKQKRKIKRRLTVRKRRKKVEKPAETSAPLKEDSTLTGIEPKKLPNIRVKKKKRIRPLHRKRPKKEVKVENNEATDVKTEDPLNSDDSDELPTILPPKRRRLQSNGNPLMMMQNSIEKGSSSERIMLEFPRHNWLEQKINQLQQTTSCSPIPDDELPSQTSPNQASPKYTSPNQACLNQASPKQASPKHASPKQASPKHASPKQASPKHASLNQASPKQASPKHASPNPASPKQASLEEGPEENSSVTIEKEKFDVDVAPTSPDCATDKDETQGASQAPAEVLPESRQESSVPDPSKESFSLQEAMQLVGAEDSEGTLVIDEGRFEGEDNVSTDKDGDNKSLVDNDKIQDTDSAEMDNPPTGESDTTPKTGGMGAPLDLCVRKNEKAQGVAGRPKAPPPVQMVLPQIQQPATPVSSDPLLMKETKDVVQNVVVVPQEGSSAPSANVEASQQALSEALNLSKVVNPSPQCPPPTDFSEMIKGVVMPVVTSESSDAQPSDHTSTSPSTETCTGATTGPGALALTQSVLPAQTGLTPVDPPVLPTAHIEPPRLPDGVMQPGHSAFGLTQAPFPVPSGAGSQVHPHPRQGLMQRNIEGNALDKEFEKHLKEFRQLEMLAARKEREREALLHLKKRKAMLLKEMKIMKTQQSSDSDNQAIRPSLAHNEAQFAAAQGLRHHMDRPNFQNTQHHAQIAELRPFQPGIQTIGGPALQTKHSMQTSSPMSQTHTSNSYDVSSHRKRPSEDRRPLVQMINLAMLQRGRKLRRLNDDHRGGTGGNSSGSVPTPAHQNKSDTNINTDADVPSSEITHSPYIKRKTPILEPPGSNRSLPTSAALVPAHSQQPFQTAGSLIVPARNGHDQNPAPPPPYPIGTHRMNMVSPSGQSQNYQRPSPTQGQHKNNLTDVHNETISQNPSDPNFNIHHVSQDQPMPYVGNSADRSVVNPNSNPNIFQNPNPSPNLQPLDHFGNVPPQWSPNIQNQFQNNPRGPLQGPHAGMQPMRPPGPPSMNQFAPSSQPYGIRPDRNVDVIDLTTEQAPRKMMHRMPGGETGGTETSVQRELTAALAKRQGLDQPMTPRRKPEASTPTNYTTNSYGNPINSQSVQHRPQSNALYSPQGHAQSGNMMPPTSINPQFQMQQRPGAVGNQYRMQEPTSVKSALLAHGTKMICPPSYPMNTSTAPATSYSSAQYQQQRPMNVSQQMSGSSHSVEGYSPVADKSPMAPGMTNMQQVPHSYNDHPHVSRTVGQFKPQQNWRPQVPTSVSNVQMSFDKQQQLMMITRKTQWEQFQQQKHAMAQKGLAAGNQMHEMHTAVSTNPQVPGPMYAIAQAAAPVVADSMQQRAAMHQHSIRMMQRTPGPSPAQIQGKLAPPPAYPRDSAMMMPSQNPAPALIEFQQQEGQRRMQPMAVNQPPPRLHQFNGSCVVCGALAMYLCSSCRMVWYCSQPCQNNHWKRHGAECKPVQKPGMPGQM